jgi:hypothetical protein
LRLYAFVTDRLKGDARIRSFFTRIGLIKSQKLELLPPDLRLKTLGAGGGMASLLRELPPAIEQAYRLITKNLDGIGVTCRERAIGLDGIVIPTRRRSFRRSSRSRRYF